MKNKSKILDATKVYSQDGYPLYPAADDIYNKSHNETNIKPTDITSLKTTLENGLEADYIDMELDVPGADLDDAEEEIGSEDEENNYYSIGGDSHNDLEEDNNKNY